MIWGRHPKGVRMPNWTKTSRGRDLQSRAQHIVGFVEDVIPVVGRGRWIVHLEIDTPTDCNGAVSRGSVGPR